MVERLRPFPEDVVGKLLGFAGATAGGTVGWWLGAHVGLLTGFLASAVGSGVGMYAARRLFSDYLG